MQLLVAIWASIHQTGHSLETTGDKNAGEPRVYHARTSFDAASVSDDGQQPSVVGSHGIDYPMLLSENVSSFQLKSVDFASIRTKQVSCDGRYHLPKERVHKRTVASE